MLCHFPHKLSNKLLTFEKAALEKVLVSHGTEKCDKYMKYAGQLYKMGKLYTQQVISTYKLVKTEVTQTCWNVCEPF